MAVALAATASAWNDPVVTLHQQAVELARSGHHDEAFGILWRLRQLAPADASIVQDMAAVAAWGRDCDQALRSFAELPADVAPAPYAAIAVGWCLVEAERPTEAVAALERSLAGSPDTVELLYPLAYAQNRAERTDEARATLDRLLARQPDDLGARYLRAELLTTEDDRVGALLDLLHVLAVDPREAKALGLAAYTLADLGAVGAARDLLAGAATAPLPDVQPGLARYLDEQEASRWIRWGHAVPVFDPAALTAEADRAVEQLERVRFEDWRDRRALFDLILAERLRGNPEQVMVLVDHAVALGFDLPVWIRQAEADAALALNDYDWAEAAYLDVRSRVPGGYEPGTGLFWVDLETGRPEAACAALAGIAAETRDQRFRVDLLNAWFEVYQARLWRGIQLFEALQLEAPANGEIRAALSQALLWMEHPRAALERADDALTRTTSDEPWVDNVGARLARIGALTRLGDLARARDEAVALLQIHPDHAHVVRAERDVRLLWRPDAGLDVRYQASDKGLEETVATGDVGFQAGSRMRLFARSTHSRSNDRAYEAGDLDRYGLGATVRLSRGIGLRQEFATDYDDNSTWDSATRLSFWPSDRWTVEASFATDAPEQLPLRARAADIGAEQWGLGVVWDDHHAWGWRASAQYLEFDDGNERRAAMLQLGRTVEVGPRRIQRTTVEVYGSDNTLDNAVYFNPSRDRSLNLGHRIEWIHTNLPHRRHVGRLQLVVGVYDQEGFDRGITGGAVYEQDWWFSGRTSLVYGLGGFSRLYDGGREFNPLAYITVRTRF